METIWGPDHRPQNWKKNQGQTEAHLACEQNTTQKPSKKILSADSEQLPKSGTPGTRPFYRICPIEDRGSMLVGVPKSDEGNLIIKDREEKGKTL